MSAWSRGRVAYFALALVLCSCLWSAAARELHDNRRQQPPQQQHRRHRRQYCERADPAWRAYLAPVAFEGTVRSVAGSEGEEKYATVHVSQVLRKQGGWPRKDLVLRLQLPTEHIGGCVGRFEAAIHNGQNYIVFAERRGHAAHALGPPLRKTKKLLKRIRAIYASKARVARVKPMKSVRVASGSVAKLECQANGRPPPRITWYKGGVPLTEVHVKRIRVQTYRRRSVLVIRHSRREDSGKYECRAQGAIGPPDIATANITVITPPPVPPDTTTWGTQCPMPNPSSYCLNGGTCLFFEEVREASCKCPEGFNGQRCERKDVSNRSNVDGSNDWE